MTIETANYINELNENLPAATDSVAEGADHLRLIKQTLKNTFPNIGEAVTITAEDINRLLFEKKNYDNVTNPTENDLREPNTIDECIDYHFDSLEEQINVSNEENLTAIYAQLESLEALYKIPVGDSYVSILPNDPNELLGYGIWEAVLEGVFPVGSGSRYGMSYNLGQSGGSASVILSNNEMPNHKHYTVTSYPNRSYVKDPNGSFFHYGTELTLEGTFPTTEEEYFEFWFNGNKAVTGNNGSGEPHNNLCPSYCFYIWKRIS